MKQDADGHSLADAQLEELLVEFFQKEMPAELRAIGGRSLPKQRTDDNAHTVRNRSAGWSVLVAVAAMALFAVLIWPESTARKTKPVSIADSGTLGTGERESFSGPTDSNPTERFSDLAEADRSSIPDEAGDGTEIVDESEVEFEFTLMEPAIEITGRVQPTESEVFETDDGPVEMRTDKSVSNVVLIDPATGTKVEYELHELTIEIFPIEDDEE